MTTVLEEYTTEGQGSVVRFFGGAVRRLTAKDIHKETFSLYGGKCLLSKAFHNWVANVSWMTKKLKRRCGID
jgi:hypothetical protein